MKLQVIKTEAGFDSAAAERIIAAIKDPECNVIGLSTGRTTGNMHRLVAAAFREQRFDASKTTFFALDEITGIPRDNHWACYAKLKYEMLDELGVDDQHFLALPTHSDDFEKSAAEFYSELQKRGGIDLLVLGLGEDGHLGFNIPGSSFEGGKHLFSMHAELDRRIREDCGFDDSVKMGGITIDIPEIMSAKTILMVAKGSNKAEILKKLIYGPVTEDVPASILQRHPSCTILMDDAAASCFPAE